MKTALKTITSHSGHARFLAEVDFVGLTKRIEGVPSPYSFGHEDAVYSWRMGLVFIRETSHKRFQVFEVPAGAEVYKESKY
jgi:hypothetical protein